MVLIIAIGAQTIFLVITWVSRYAFICLHIFDLRSNHRLLARRRSGYFRAGAHCVGCRCWLRICIRLGGAADSRANQKPAAM